MGQLVVCCRCFTVIHHLGVSFSQYSHETAEFANLRRRVREYLVLG